MDVTVTFIGNATTLISGGRDNGDERSREEQITLLTDPNFLHQGQHAYLGYGLLSKRRHGPALDIDQLPALDAVVLSHIPIDRFLPPVMGSMIEFSDGTARRRRYVSGDTLLVDELRDIPVRFESIDVGVLHLGGTRLPFGRHPPLGLTVTMDRRQGADAVELLNLPRMIPVHFDDYGVFASPLSDFVDEMKRRGLSDRIIELDRGSSVTV